MFSRSLMILLFYLLQCDENVGQYNKQPRRLLRRAISNKLPLFDKSDGSFGDFNEHSVHKNTVPSAEGNHHGKVGREQNFDQPSTRHHFFQTSNDKSKQLKDLHFIFENTTKALKSKYNLSNADLGAILEIDLKSEVPGKIIENCNQIYSINCNYKDIKYRAYDGTCNNLENPSWGMASSCFERIMPPSYSDGISKFRLAESGNELPSPRIISLIIHNDLEFPSQYLTHMFMVWGQFIDHDMALSPLHHKADNKSLNCCPISDDNDPECAPIKIFHDDPFYSPLGIDCLNNVRTVACTTCALGPRQQTNQLTHFIDASMIYGISKSEADELRNWDGLGTLRSSITSEGYELLPPVPDPSTDGCSSQNQNLGPCFLAGDTRVNLHPALTSFHTIFLRHHNLLTQTLSIYNKDWDDEKLYQETRRIIAAQIQMITYNEFLPLVIGPEGMKLFDLSVKHDNSYTEYNPEIKPSLLNEFSTAAFRFGHSLINRYFRVLAKGNDFKDSLSTLFLWPFDLYDEEYFKGIVSGLFQSPSQIFDRWMVGDVTNHLYQKRGNISGLDLASLNIVRGRDHGIQPYVKIVEWCGGPRINAFEDLEKLFRPGEWQLFQSIYESVHDIDLFPGGLAEIPVNGGQVGPTFSCIIGQQFHRLKYGDRFYFEHGGQAGSFTPDQLNELKKTTFAQIICRHTGIKYIESEVFLRSPYKNTTVLCTQLKRFNLQSWANKRWHH